MKRGVLALMFLAAVLIATDSRGEADAAMVTFTVEENRINLGEIRSGKDAVATFVFHNEGEEDVKILRAKPS